MAKNTPSDGSKVSVSRAVREFLAANPAADTKSVITGLAGTGVKVSPTMVYYVRSKMGQARRKDKREKVAATSRSMGTANPVEVVLRVKDLARELGGIANLKLLVDLLAE